MAEQLTVLEHFELVLDDFVSSINGLIEMGALKINLPGWQILTHPNAVLGLVTKEQVKIVQDALAQLPMISQIVEVELDKFPVRALPILLREFQELVKVLAETFESEPPPIEQAATQ